MMADYTTAQLARLLNLYPVALVREQWALKGKRKDQGAQEVASMAPQAEILSFARQFHGCTKQHVFLYEHHKEPLPALPDDLLGLGFSTSSAKTTAGHEDFQLVPLVFTVVLRDPWEEMDLKFLWPVGLTASESLVKVSMTILEKNLRSHIHEPARYYSATRSMSEADLVKAALRALADLELSPMDLNKGVKGLWDGGIIDGEAVSWKGARSTSSERMDEKFLVKRDLPEVYEQNQANPILKSIFRAMVGDGSDEVRFAVDPTAGIAFFPRYSGDPAEKERVINAILESNR